MESQPFDERLLRQEVEELTEMLRHEEILADLRALLREKGQNPDELLLAGFLENADGLEAGVIITPHREVFEFERSAVGRSTGFLRWLKVADVSVLLDTYPAVLTAREMASE